MITPCNAENGCGTLMHTGSTDTASPFAPAESIGRSQMTDVTNSRRNENIQMQNGAASVKYRQAAARCKAPKVSAAAETVFGRTEL